MNIPARSLAERGQNAASLLRTYFLPNTAGDVEALVERVAQLEEALTAIQWGSCDGCGRLYYCPLCGRKDEAGHDSECIVGTALKYDTDGQQT